MMIDLPESYIPKSGNIRVGSDGLLSSKLAIVGEAPGRFEVASGIPFQGKSGNLLNLLLEKAGIGRENCYVTNLFKYEVTKRTVKKKECFFKGSSMVWHPVDGFMNEGERSFQELLEELSAFKGNVICPLGNASLFALTGHIGITKYRGSILWSTVLDKKIIPTIHPAAALREYLLGVLIKRDLDLIREEKEFKELNLPNPSLLISPSFTQAKLYLEDILKSYKTIAFDIETLNSEVSCISFAKSKDDAISIPFVMGRENFFSLEQERELWLLITTILQNDKIEKIGQNISFDMTFLFSKYGIRTQNWQDTMIAHKILLPEFPMGLDFITSTYTKHPYYKDEGKSQIRAPKDWDVYWRYNAKDSIICREVWPLLKRDLIAQGNWDAYQHQNLLIAPIMYMGYRGIRVDKDRLDRLSKESEARMEEIKKAVEEEVGYPLNPNSSQQGMKYFYEELKIKPYKEKGKKTLNEGALVRLSRRGYKVAKLLLKYRQESTMNSRYYKMKLRERDGETRMTCSYKPVTKMARLSSSKDLDGYGGNMQNQPKKMNLVFLADEGYLVFNSDLRRADMWTVAFVGKVKKMMEALQAGEDIHSLTASGIFNIPIEQVKEMDKKDIKCKLGYGDKTHRKWGKESGHALNFDLGYKSFSYRLEIPEKEGLFLVKAYHDLYPEVRSGYHKAIQNQLSRNRTVTNCFGRKFLLLNRWDDNLFKDAYAFPAQSNTVEIINRWGLLEFYYNDEFKEVDLLRQVHDSINFQIKISLGAEAIYNLLIKMRRSLERPLKWEDREFTIPSDWSVGFDFKNQKELDLDNKSQTIKILKELIENEKTLRNSK